MRRLVASGIVGIVLSLGGCATTYDEKLTNTLAATGSETDASQAATLVAEGDALWAERLDEGKLKEALAKWEQAIKLSPSADLANKLARGHYLLGDGHYALADKTDARDSEYQLGLDWANEALKLSAPEYAAAKIAGKPHGEAIRLASKEAVPAMYWYATNLGKWAAGKGLVTRLKYKDDLFATMTQVKSLDEQFFYAAAWRYFGSYEAVASGIAGGDLGRSRTNFEKAIALAPNYFGTKVLFADLYCPKMQKDDDGDGEPDGKKLFKQLLEDVIAADASVDPAIAPENQLEQRKAKKLLARIDDLF
jgi:tetratricopeptide (TPR) repeat protein